MEKLENFSKIINEKDKIINNLVEKIKSKVMLTLAIKIMIWILPFVIPFFVFPLNNVTLFQNLVEFRCM